MALRTRAGVQGPIFVSPESLVGSLAEPLRDAASRGLIRYFVIDEAHMVTAWGDDFRPAFQQLAGLRRDLLDRSGNHPFITVLMSATLTPYSLECLYDLFGEPGPVHQIHAVRLRPEPSYWLCHAPNEQKRQLWVQDAVDHLPRPLILYTTRRADAEAWFHTLHNSGYERIGLMHGRTPDDKRSLLLDAWNQDELDIVVATSAFGLGVDKPDIRAVVHATCPEDIDRYYQDVGRTGRDGFASLSLMIRVNRDVSYAKRLAIPKFIGVERGLERWSAMFGSAERGGDGHCYNVPLDVSPSHRPRDIDMSNEENERWSVRTLLLMRRAGLIEIAGSHSNLSKGTFVRTVQVLIRDHEHLEARTWKERVEPLRQALLRQNKLSWALMEKALTGKACLSRVFEEAYTSPKHDINVVRACGGCPACRSEKEPPKCGRMIPRHSPDIAWPATPVGPALGKLLAGGHLALLFHKSQEAIDNPRVLADFAAWCCRQGVQNLIIPPEWHQDWREVLMSLSIRPLFLWERMPSGIARLQPTAAFLFGPLGVLWRDFWVRMPIEEGNLVLALPDDIRQPERPDRFVQDILIQPPRFTLSQWEEMYQE
jgi:hypothetical protein